MCRSALRSSHPSSSPLQALLLYTVLRVPQDMLWQTIIRLTILTDYGLYAPTSDRELPFATGPSVTDLGRNGSDHGWKRYCNE